MWWPWRPNPTLPEIKCLPVGRESIDDRIKGVTKKTAWFCQQNTSPALQVANQRVAESAVEEKRDPPDKGKMSQFVSLRSRARRMVSDRKKEQDQAIKQRLEKRQAA